MYPGASPVLDRIKWQRSRALAISIGDQDIPLLQNKVSATARCTRKRVTGKGAKR